MTAFDHYAKALRFAFECTEKSRVVKEYKLRRRHRSQAEIDWRLREAKNRVRLRVFKLHSRQLFKEIERLVDTDNDFGKNVFDIEADNIVFYTDHEIIPKALPAIQHIQKQLKEIEKIGKQLWKGRV